MRQQEAYINLIMHNNDVVAVKFGIANNSERRIKKQDSASTYTLKQHSVYIFPDTSSCKAAERQCRQTLETCVVLKRDMLDGYTETTWAYNLDKIIEIYKNYGGVLKMKYFGDYGMTDYQRIAVSIMVQVCENELWRMNSE